MTNAVTYLLSFGIDKKFHPCSRAIIGEAWIQPAYAETYARLTSLKHVA